MRSGGRLNFMMRLSGLARRFRSDGLVRDDGELVVLHLRDAAFNLEVERSPAGGVDPERAFAELGQHGSAVRKDAKLPVEGREDDLSGGLVKNFLLGRHHGACK